MADLAYSLKNQGVELSKLLAIVRAGELSEEFIKAHLQDPKSQKIARALAGREVPLTAAERRYRDVVRELAGV